ncbi:hypothetical protein OROGR_026999 [Orobanche gracilis]
MATSRSGAGGKMVTNRRKERLSATPYDRPPPRPSPPPKSPNWFTGVILPSARFLASGAGKILNSIFTESESSSSENESSASDDDIDNENHYEIPCNGVNMFNERNVTSSEAMHHGQESQLNMWSTETKWTIEQLITQETFSREEYDKLIKVLNSRVTEAGEKNLFAGSPGKMVDNEDTDIYDKAVQEAKKWFQEKKAGSSSVTELAHETSNRNSTGLGHVETGGGTPVDVAKSYMKERPPWSSSTGSVELRTPLATTMKLFKERTLFSVGQDSLSSSKKGNSLVSGSWNIQEELRRVRSKATEDMLRSPSAKIDPSLFAVRQNRAESLGDGEVLFGTGERITETESIRKTKPVDALVDAGVSSEPVLTALQSSKPIPSVSGKNEDSEAVPVEGEFAAARLLHLSSPNHREDHHASPSWSDIIGVPVAEVTVIDKKQNVNGVLPSSQPSLSLGRNSEQHDEENHNTDTVNEIKPANIINVEGNCELLSEAYMDVPILTETDSIASGSQNSLGMQYGEIQEKVDVVFGKQQARKLGRINRRGRGRGK